MKLEDGYQILNKFFHKKQNQKGCRVELTAFSINEISILYPNI